MNFQINIDYMNFHRSCLSLTKKNKYQLAFMAGKGDINIG